MAYTDYINTVQSIYIAYYQRPADPGGLRYWAERLDKAGGNLDAIIDEFSTSEESAALYTQTDPLELVNSIYQALFGRDADGGADNFYVQALHAGEYPDGRPATLGRVALDVLNGAQNDDAVAIANKLVAANRFTEAVDGRALTDPDFGTGTKFAVTYEGDDDAAAARDFLKAVTSSPATVPTKSDVLSYVQAHIADAGDAIGQEVIGKSFVLTPGIDIITGTAGNDTIIGVLDSATTESKSTLTLADQIDGGGGKDTLKIFLEGEVTTGLPTAATITNVEVIEFIATAAGNTFSNPDEALDASKFTATELWQDGDYNDVVNLAATQVAGFRNVKDLDVAVTAADKATSAAIALDGVTVSTGEDEKPTAHTTITVSGGDNLSGVTVSGTLGTKGDVLDLTFEVGKNATTATINVDPETELTLDGGDKLETINASASKGGIEVTLDANLTDTLKSVTTGSGDDHVTIDAPKKDLTIDLGAGDDTLDLSDIDFTTNHGNLSIVLGAGSDTVKIDLASLGNIKVDEDGSFAYSEILIKDFSTAKTSKGVYVGDKLELGIDFSEFKAPSGEGVAKALEDGDIYKVLELLDQAAPATGDYYIFNDGTNTYIAYVNGGDFGEGEALITLAGVHTLTADSFVAAA